MRNQVVMAGGFLVEVYWDYCESRATLKLS